MPLVALCLPDGKIWALQAATQSSPPCGADCPLLHISHRHPKCCPSSDPLPTSLKQVSAKSQPHPCLECSYSHQNPGLPEALSSLWAPRVMYCSPKWLSQLFLTWLAPPGPCIEYTAMLFVLSPWLHPAFFQGKSCVVFLACLGLMQGLSLWWSWCPLSLVTPIQLLEEWK